MKEYKEDIRDKSITARSSHSRVSHGGRVRLPSDHMTKKELRNMSGTCETWNLNKPMEWQEFKAMPDDIKVMYIDRIRERFGAVPNVQLCKLFGAADVTIGKELHRIGVKPVCGFGGKGARIVYEKQAFEHWCGLQSEVVEETPVPETEPAEEAAPAAETAETGTHWSAFAPHSGELCFEGDPMEICQTLIMLLGSGPVRLTIGFHRVGDNHG